MATRRHISFDGLGFFNVYNRVEEVCLSVLATEILVVCQFWSIRTDPGGGKLKRARVAREKGGEVEAYSTDDILMVR